MTFLNLLFRLFGVVSLAVLTWSIYLIWTGYERAEDAEAYGIDGNGDDWRLWLGWGLLALSFLGRFIWPLLLAKPEKGDLRSSGARGARSPALTARSSASRASGPRARPPSSSRTAGASTPPCGATPAATWRNAST
jgi:hypothetical protein